MTRNESELACPIAPLARLRFVAGVGTPTPEDRSEYRGLSTDPGHELLPKN